MSLLYKNITKLNSLIGNEGDKEEKYSNINKLKKILKGKPVISTGILIVIIVLCLFGGVISTYNPQYMDLGNVNIAPNTTFYFGTDSMGRDIFSMIWAGGKISLFIGIFSTVISTGIAVVYGSFSGLAPEWIDDFLMWATEIILSIPSILIIIFLQAIIGSTSPLSISVVIGITSWMSIAKIVRSEVRQIRNSEYILAVKIMGGNFFYILKNHLLPNFIPSIMFMVVSNIGVAIATESTLSFIGIGLPVEIISWGSMLSLSQDALLSNYWWIILIPGIFLVTVLVSITNIGNHLRKKNIKKSNNI
ncbi:MAG: ABC transporter permease [Clostridium sp.]